MSTSQQSERRDLALIVITAGVGVVATVFAIGAVVFMFSG